jgi:ferritin-like metal-binding protein YciE
MTDNTPVITTLQHLLNYDISKFTSAEVQLKHSLPGWINKTNSLKLKTILQKYLDFVQEHTRKIESIFDKENITSLSMNNGVMKAFIEDTEEKYAHCTDPEIKDASLLASIQAINHFKISTYGTAAAFAKALGMEEEAEIFHEIEVNEKQIDDRLTQLAEFEINIKARAPFVLPQ